eukprot:TRINITY_DN809_c0_g1_i5.p1 TRINITY_DN809_c0_g1~~TRINITY_DN809_c0_g1_i5.p1  ORF type:complete len:320 (+),score=95.43 TRINITY_DN809_c0_g1_i5:95-961(+)
MRVTSKFLKRFHLDPRYSLLTGRNLQLLREFFTLLDVRGIEGLDDLQFLALLQEITDLTERSIYTVFDMFDVDNSGSIEFDEFYLLCCMLIAVKDNEVKQFLFRHWRTCFELLDDDGSQSISLDEFLQFGFIFNFSKRSVMEIFNEFDVDRSQELDYDEFRMFSFACIDRERQIEQEMLAKQLAKQNNPRFGFLGRFRKKKEEGSMDGALSMGLDGVLFMGLKRVDSTEELVEVKDGEGDGEEDGDGEIGEVIVVDDGRGEQGKGKGKDDGKDDGKGKVEKSAACVVS